MTTTADMMERHGRWLAEAGEMAMSLMRAVHRDGIAATEPAERRAAAASLDGLTRSLRLTAHLEARLAREAARAAREVEVHAETVRKAQIKRKRDRMQKTLERYLRAETEDDNELLSLSMQLDDRMDEEALSDGFLDGDYQEQIVRLATWLEIEPPDPDGEGAAPEPPNAAASSTPNGNGAHPSPQGEDWRRAVEGDFSSA